MDQTVEKRSNLLPRDGEVFYFPHFFSPEKARAYEDQALTEVDWREEAIRIFGKSILQPRRTAWYGDKDYSYSHIRMEKKAWLPFLSEMKTTIESAFDLQLNGVLLNHYRNGQDSMGWHRDNEKELGPEPVIASVSLGETRRFLLRHRKDPKLKVELHLEHGSLLIMQGLSQECWDHSIPKTSLPVGGRINFTFRRLF